MQIRERVHLAGPRKPHSGHGSLQDANAQDEMCCAYIRQRLAKPDPAQRARPTKATLLARGLLLRAGKMRELVGALSGSSGPKLSVGNM